MSSAEWLFDFELFFRQSLCRCATVWLITFSVDFFCKRSYSNMSRFSDFIVLLEQLCFISIISDFTSLIGLLEPVYRLSVFFALQFFSESCIVFALLT